MGKTGINFSHTRWPLVIGMAGLYVCIFIALSFHKYNHYLYRDWDLAIYNQFFRSFLRGTPYTSLLGVPFLGSHVEITMAAFVPLYALFPSPPTLLVIQTVMLASAVIPLFLITRTVLDERYGVMFTVLYLLYPAVCLTNLNEFHPESFLPFLQFYLFYFFIKNDFKKFILIMFACLFAKENMSLVLIMVGCYSLMAKREKRWIFAPILSGGAWFLLHAFVLLPNLTQDKIGFYNLYGPLGKNLGQIIAAVITHPVKIFHYLAMPEKTGYLVMLFAPLCFLPLLSPSTLSICLPNFLQHFLSSRATETSIAFFYPVEITAFIFISAVFGLRVLKRRAVFSRFLRPNYSFLIPAFALTFSAASGWYTVNGMNAGGGRADAVKFKDALIRMIPEGASVVATLQFLPKLSTVTDRLYSFHSVANGTYLLSDKKYILPADVEYALIDFDNITIFHDYARLGDTVEKNTERFFQERKWVPLQSAGTVVLYKRDFKAASPGGSEHKAYVPFLKLWTHKAW